MVAGIFESITEVYRQAEKRIFFLDYDGTLVPFNKIPGHAFPDQRVIKLLEDLASDEKNTVVIISGRDRDFLDQVFSGMNITLVAEHGFFIRKPGSSWRIEARMNNTWKNMVREEMERYQQIFPGSMVEEKTSALVWHYRNSVTKPENHHINELKSRLSNILMRFGLEPLDGNKVLEVREKTVNKGIAANDLLKELHPDFILAMGDDVTDEYLFKALPDNAFTIKVGSGKTSAKYCCLSLENAINMISYLLKR